MAFSHIAETLLLHRDFLRRMAAPLQFGAAFGEARASANQTTDRFRATEFECPLGDMLVFFTGAMRSSIIYSYNQGCEPPPVEQIVRVEAGALVEVVCRAEIVFM